jgi:glyoxylase-like metal-dependent hydrolase (beta-lactamase superfamily II)
MREIVPGVYTFEGLMAGRVYLLEGEAGLTLIDTSIANAGKKILAQLQKAGHQPGDVKQILLTHAHPDHVGGLEVLKSATGAAVICSELEKPVIQGETPVPRSPSGLRLPKTVFKRVDVDWVIEDGEILDGVLGGITAVFTPGHAPGHLSFWQPDRRIIFTGDVIFNWPSLRLPFAMLTVDVAENIRSVGKVAALEPSIACFGHAKPMVSNTAEAIYGLAQRSGQGNS